MPLLSNIQLLVRSQPGGLGDHRKLLTEHINSLIEKNRFFDLVILSADDGEAVQFNQSLIVPRSPLLRSLCQHVPQYPGDTSIVYISVHIKANILRTIRELLYSGQVCKTKKEIEEVSNGLALLGIDDFSSLPPQPPPSSCMPGITAIPLAKETNQTQEVPTQSRQEKPPAQRQNNNFSLMIKQLESDVAKKKVDESNNNGNVCKSPSKAQASQSPLGRKRKRGRPRIDYQEEDTTDEEEIELEGSPVTEEIEDEPTGNEVQCPECDSLLKSAWYLPPSRHPCNSIKLHADNSTSSDDEDEDNLEEEPEEERTPKKKRRLLIDSKTKSVKKTSESNTKKESSNWMFVCPLDGCARECNTKSTLMVHLAISHFLKKLETIYSRDGEDGAKCPHCNIDRATDLLVFLKHIATKHEDVIENMVTEAHLESTLQSNGVSKD